MSRRSSPVAMAATVMGVLPALAAFPGSAAHGGVVPQFLNGSGSGSHSTGEPSGTTTSLGVSLVDGSASLTYSDTITFAGGSTVAKGGMARTQSSTSVRVTFAAGTGVSQVDPDHARSASTVQLNFLSTWMIDNGTFGPPIATSFSVPIGLNIGAGGSGSFACDVHWDATVGGMPFTDARTPFVTNITYGPGKYLTSITAPAAPFALPSLTGNASVPAYITLRGSVMLSANNDDGPSLVEFPTRENFGDLPNFDQFTFEPGITFVEVPEPGAAGVVGAAAAGLLAARRRRHRSPGV
jgi:hypothetical protein